MEKLLSLLHEGTIINIRVLFALSRRYKVLFPGAVILFGVLLCYSVYIQPTIYSVTVPLKEEMSHKISADLSSLLPVENTNRLTVEELTISLTSAKLMNKLSEDIYNHKNFDRLNFSFTESSKKFTGVDIKKSCKQSKECAISTIGEKIRSFISLEQDVATNRFKLIVNTTDKETTLVVSELAASDFELERIRLRQAIVQKEIVNVSSLIDESRLMMKKLGGYEALHEQEKLNNDISDLRDRLKMIQVNLSEEEANYSAFKAKLAENRKRVKSSSVDSDRYEAFMKIHARLNELKQNISLLLHIPDEERSATDKKILAQLQSEKMRLVQKLPEEERFQEIKSVENFKEKQMENSGNVEFDFVVSKNKMAKLNSDFDEARKELDQLLKQKISVDTRLNGMKTDLDFLSGLESKLMSLKLINATMNSDLIFEDGSQVIDEFRRASFLKLTFYCFFISSFIYLFSIVLKYSLDDKIYGEDDLRLYFKKLDFIGEVPSFD